MKKTFVVMITLLSFLLCSSLAMADLYRWVDKDGNVHVTNTPPQGRGAKVEQMRENKRHHARPDSSSQSKADKKKKKEDKKKERKAAKKEKKKFYAKYPGVKVQLYVTSWCADCKKAIAFFKASGVSLQVFDVEKNQNAAKRKDMISPAKTIPVAVIGDGEIVVIGFNESEYSSALKKSK